MLSSQRRMSGALIRRAGLSNSTRTVPARLVCAQLLAHGMEAHTLQLWCRCNFNYWIAADLEWRVVEIDGSTGPAVETPSQMGRDSNSPHLLGQVDVEIRLINRLPERVRHSILATSTIINGLGLTDDAFAPKTYRVRIEQGNFVEPCHIGFPSSDTRFTLRVLFDPSPYPPRSEWREPQQWGVDDGGQFWDQKEFVAQPAPGLAGRGEAMNNKAAGGGSGCVGV